MADGKSNKSDTDLSTQSEEAREAALRRAAQGNTTATGVAARQHFGDDEIPSGEERGSTREIAGGDSIKADFAKPKGGKPQGMQAEEAIFTTNGTVPPGMVPTQSGPVPVSAVARTKEAASERSKATMEQLDQQLKPREYSEVSEDVIQRASAAELRAVARDRNYDLGGPAGRRATQARFRRAQQDDPAFSRESEPSNADLAETTKQNAAGGDKKD